MDFRCLKWENKLLFRSAAQAIPAYGVGFVTLPKMREKIYSVFNILLGIMSIGHGSSVLKDPLQ